MPYINFNKFRSIASSHDVPDIDFNKFHPITLSPDVPESVVSVLRDRLVDSDINIFFRSLQEIENSEELLTKKDELFNKCDEIISRNTLLSGALPKFIVASMFAVKMKICDILISDYEKDDAKKDDKAVEEVVNNCRDFVKKNYGNFLRAADDAGAMMKELNPQILALVGNTLFLNWLKLSEDVMLHLDRSITIKDKTSLDKVSVPDVLASASYVENNNSPKIDIRDIFRELWEIESLRPLLTVSAYFSQKDESPLRTLFCDGLFNGNYSSDYAETTGLCSKDPGIIAISYNKKSLQGEFIPRSKAEIKGTIVHELHHFWEGQNYGNSNSPYKRSILGKDVETVPWPLEIPLERLSEYLYGNGVQPSNSQIKTQLNDMVSEIKKINKDKSAFVSSTISRDGNVNEVYQPFKIFDFLRSYAKNRSIQRNEIVVRVSNVLGECVGEGYTEEEVIELIRDSGLEECLKFFNQEKEQMIAKAEEFAKKTGISFSQEFVENSEYLESKLTTPHFLDEAIKDNYVERVFALCSDKNTMQEFVRNPRLLHKSVLYLVNLAKDEGSKYSEEALSLFRGIKSEFEENQSPAISVVFANVRRLTMDQDRITSITPEEVCEKASRSATFEEDKFGNSFIDYAVDAYYAHQDKKIEQNKFYTKINSVLGLDSDWDSSMRLLIQRVEDNSKKPYGKNSKALSDILPSGRTKDSQCSRLSTREIDNNI